MQSTLLLKRPEVRALLTIDECIDAVERVFKLQGEGKTSPPGILGFHAAAGGFHIKAALHHDGETYCVAKLNSNFPSNPGKLGLPSIQGVLALFSGENGFPLAVMDAVEITALRTGAAAAVAAKYLSRADASVATICGAGVQGHIQLRSLMRVRQLRHAFVYDIDEARALQLARRFSGDLATEAIAHKDLSSSLRKSDICVTCTPSRKFFLEKGDISPGTFIAAVGADSEEKQEIDPELFPASTVVVDLLEQCASIGDLHHALRAGIVRRENVHAELGEIVAGRKPGRTSDKEITIFDSTGIALQDAAAAILVYDKAKSAGIGESFQFQ